MSVTKQLRGLGFTAKQIKSINNYLLYRCSRFGFVKLVSIVNGEKIRFYEFDGMCLETNLSRFTKVAD